MAETTAYLEGGPCDGKTQVVAVTGKAPLFVTCSDGFYNITKPHRYHNGDLVYTYAGIAPVPPPAGSVKAARLHKGYADLQHSVNVNMPTALTSAHRNLAAGLRSVHRARKVRI